MIQTICIAGAGTMGAGIAQLSAQSGFTTLLFDVNKEALEKAKHQITTALQSLVERKKITPDDMISSIQRLSFIDNPDNCIADLIIEAIVEKVEAKTSFFQHAEKINAGKTFFASNTSSLSVSVLQQRLQQPSRLAGMHFFNPAPVMKLVELVKGERTSEETIKILTEVSNRMNKIAVICKDAPGFIVNRIARHYYLEALRLVEEGKVTIEEVDSIMEASGFKMGPFRLMDLIGIDINLAVSQSIYESFNRTERFVPSFLQINKVEAGELGKKTGKGFYSY